MTDRKPFKASYSPRQKGISIRTLSVVLFIVAILAILFSFFESQRTMYHAQALYELEQERRECESAIQRFMDGSDYLTGQVQQFTVQGEREYMDNYWTEVYETKSRDEAVDVILNADTTSQEREAAKDGKSESDALIEGEIWAMRMVCESVGILKSDMPADVAAFKLSPEDAALSPEEKRLAAMEYVFGPEYSLTKSAIRSNVNIFRNEITTRYANEALSSLSRIQETTFYMSVGLIVFLIVLIVTIICFMTQVISPLTGFFAILTRGQSAALKLRENGALEIKQFARAFNELSEHVEQNTKRLERISYTDYLTDVPNRASITEYVTALIAHKKQPFGLMIIDIDDFKRVNDTYGHAFGDRVLRRVAQAVCSVHPSSEGISGRLCGEEFVIASQNADEDLLRAAAEKMLQNVRDIKGGDVGLCEVSDFHITVSIGGMIWRGELPTDFHILLSKADKALYKSKCSGKDKYTFYCKTAND